MTDVCFVADLHKFALRSDADLVEPAIREAAARSDLCVLGGDIFDFRWSTYPSPEATAEAAIAWLRDLTTAIPDTDFVLLLGNHDHAEPLLERLPRYAESAGNFEWFRYYLRVGSAVFLHGDAADVPRRSRTGLTHAGALQRMRERSRHHGQRPRGKAQNHVYRQFVRSRLHHVVPRIAYPKRRVVRRLHAYLEHLNLAAKDGVRSVYFGHTHFPVDGLRYAGLTFHNGGAPIGDRSFRVLTARLEPDADRHGH